MKSLPVRLILSAIVGIIIKIVSNDLIIDNFGGQTNMNKADFSETQTVSYTFAIFGFLVTLLITYLIAKRNKA